MNVFCVQILKQNFSFLQKVFTLWKSKKISSKSRWNSDKLNKYLEDGIDGKLSKSDIKALREELILIEVEKKNKELSSQIKVSYVAGFDIEVFMCNIFLLYYC